MNQKLESVKNLIRLMLEKMGIKADVEFMETSEGGYRFLLKTYDGALLIGENGQNLWALNHVVKKIIDKETENENEGWKKANFSLDVNDYQAKKTEDLKNLARLNAQRVRYFKKEITMKPMTSFERKIIHSILTECPDVTTESVGEEPNRKVVIKPLSLGD